MIACTSRDEINLVRGTLRRSSPRRRRSSARRIRSTWRPGRSGRSTSTSWSPPARDSACRLAHDRRPGREADRPLRRWGVQIVEFDVPREGGEREALTGIPLTEAAERAANGPLRAATSTSSARRSARRGSRRTRRWRASFGATASSSRAAAVDHAGRSDRHHRLARRRPDVEPRAHGARRAAGGRRGRLRRRCDRARDRPGARRAEDPRAHRRAARGPGARGRRGAAAGACLLRDRHRPGFHQAGADRPGARRSLRHAGGRRRTCTRQRSHGCTASASRSASSTSRSRSRSSSTPASTSP